MKKITIAVLLLMAGLLAEAQPAKPVHWSFEVSMSGKAEATVLLKAVIDKGWHIYSQKTPPGGPVKTSFIFPPSEAYLLTGETTEPQALTRFEPSFGVDVSYFEDSVVFAQKIKVLKAHAMVTGTLRYMVCNDETCLPPADLDFSIPVKQ